MNSGRDIRQRGQTGRPESHQARSSVPDAVPVPNWYVGASVGRGKTTQVFYSELVGVVAQLVERLVRNEKVAGSIPVGSTIQ